MSAVAAVPQTDDPRQEWGTPRKLFGALHQRYDFTIDAAAKAWNAKLPAFWSPEDDGLFQLSLPQNDPHRAWLNPPFNNIAPWVSTLLRRAERGGCSVVMLPVRTDQKWFHLYARHGELHYFKGRIAFDAPAGIASSSNREPTMLVVFDPYTLGKGLTYSLDVKTGAFVR